MYDTVIKVFSENYPEIYRGLLNTLTGGIQPGAKKEYAIYIQGSLNKNN